MATKQLTSLDTYVVPRVNLLPPEIGAKRAAQRSYVLMGAAVAGAGAAVLALYLGQASRVTAAKEDLKAEQATNTKLKSERVKLQAVQDVYLAVDADEALLTRAFSRRVNWSVYLHSLSIGIPENVWINQLTATVTPAATGAVPVGGAPVGSLTFTGTAFAYNDVAAWLESLGRIKGVTNSYFSSATKLTPTTPKGRALVTFSSNALLTPVAVTPHTKPGSR
ncbi:MAG: PilN domain-containing protein [Mycobacteriales bacterium]